MGTSSDIKALQIAVAALDKRVDALEAAVSPPVVTPPPVTPPPVDPPPVTPPPVTPPPAAAVPVIMIIRHGEKPADSNDHTLAPKGVQRANALPPLFTKPRSDLYRPTWIFASKGATDSMRMLQTATPTAQALGLTPDTRYDSENAISQTAALLVSQAKAGQVVLAVLEHSAIPGVAKALGTSSPKAPSSWDDARFDMIYLFVGDGKGGWKFTQLNESVLPGDAGYKG